MMPSDAAPTLYAIAFELGVYAVALVVIGVLWRAGRRAEIALMVAAMAFAGALEISDIRTTHSYYYARFMVMIGSEPNWFPLAIAVAWGLVLHTVMASTARLPLSMPARALVAAPLGTLVDFVLDPVVANARVVSSIGEMCDRFDLPHGSAFGLGLWVWCVPNDPNLIWGIPFANFYAWGVVIFGYCSVAGVLREAFAPEDDGAARGFQLGLALATALAAFCLVDVALQLYTPIVMHGVPEWAMLAAVFGPGLLLLLRAGLKRERTPILLATWLFPPAALLYCLGAYVISGTAAHAGSAMLLYVVAATFACVAAYGWVLLAGKFFWTLLGQYRAASVPRGPAPTRAELLASGPDRVSQADLAAVAALRDPVLRNYMITQRYHDLSVELARLIAGPNANWCTFATWASSTAGESIREEEVPGVVVDILKGEQRLEQMLNELARALGDKSPDLGGLDIFALARDTLARVRNQVADGNRKVFAELAPLFASFIDCFDGDGKIDPRLLARFVEGLRPGPSDRDGQDLLREAFPAYAAASQEPDEARRAQLMLLGNCLIGLHEQTRLQPNIAAAIDAPVDVVATEGLLAKAAGLLPPDIRREFERLFGPASQVTLGVARAIWQRIATAAAMHISLPQGQRIPLGEDVNVSLERSFPPDLGSLQLEPLQQLAARFEADHAAPFGQGALDWASLDDRMRFIIDLFRTTQEEVRLFEQPFDPVFRLELDARFAAATARRRSSAPAPVQG